MVDDKRLTFIRRWLQTAEEKSDPFDRFFAAWIALVAASQRTRDFSGPTKDDTDRERVKDYFRIKQSKVVSALSECEPEIKTLSQRRGTKYRNPIVDTGCKELRSKLEKLSLHYTTGPYLPEDELVEAVAELLNKIRNNLFHGQKVYDDSADRKLLALANPILIKVLTICEPA